jgi:hypothetical protein
MITDPKYKQTFAKKVANKDLPAENEIQAAASKYESLSGMRSVAQR